MTTTPCQRTALLVGATIAAVLAIVAVLVVSAGHSSDRPRVTRHAGAGGAARHAGAAGAARHAGAAGAAPAAAGQEAGTAVGTPSAKGSEAKYGGLPSWLPKAKVPVGRIVTATPSHRRLAIEGDTVAVHLPSGRATVTAVGPRVPENGHFPVPDTSPCRFVVTFAAVRGALPVAARTFSFLGEHGAHNRARVTRRGGDPAPARITPGHPVILVLNAVLPTGNGQLRWAPLPGRPVVSWDFDVELD